VSLPSSAGLEVNVSVGSAAPKTLLWPLFGVIVISLGDTVKEAEPLLPEKEPSPANDAPTPVEYVPALIPLRLAPLNVATPEELVVAEPADPPLSVKLIVLPLTPEPPEVSVAESVVVPPYVPDADATLSAVGEIAGTLMHRSKIPAPFVVFSDT
jgi:hypothetical protein